MDLSQHVADVIRQLRSSYGGEGMSPTLAKELGTATNTISRWETGTYRPSLDDLDRVARFFGVSIMRFFPAEEEKESAGIQALLRAARQLQPDDLEELRRYAEFRKAQSSTGESAPSRKAAAEAEMTRSAYYQEMKALANGVRQQYGLTTPRVMRRDLRRIYKDQKIHIDLWPHRFRQLRGAYFHDGLGATVMLAKGLPEDPMVFTMGHELKHHLVDRALPVACCDVSNQNDMIEIGAEVFAAELIFPEADFAAAMTGMGVVLGACVPETLVRLKRETRTTLSYAGLAKRAEFLGFAVVGALAKVQWVKLEEKLYGEPFYKRLHRALPRKD